MAQYTWPPVSFSGTSNPSVGVNGDTAPTSSNLVGGIDSDTGDLVPMKVDAEGRVFGVLDGTSSISGTVTANQGGVWDIRNLTGTQSLPNGASTSALQTTGNASLSSIDGKTPSLGQDDMAGSVPVAIASDQTAIPVEQSGTWDIGEIVGPIALPTGASTEAKQDDEIAALDSIDTKTPALGQAAMAASVPVVIANNQSAVPVSGTVAISGTSPISGTVSAMAKTPVAGTVTQAAISVGTSAVRLTVSGSAPNAARSALVVTPDPTSVANFYIGSSSVTTTSTTRGIYIKAGQSFIANNDAGDYYIISDTATQTVFVMEQA